MPYEEALMDSGGGEMDSGGGEMDSSERPTTIHGGSSLALVLSAGNMPLMAARQPSHTLTT
jgi:hypothetical protein